MSKAMTAESRAEPNIGYVLFLIGIVCLALAGIGLPTLAAAPTPACSVTAMGDVAVCAPDAP
jgi:hypothetical protein